MDPTAPTPTQTTSAAAATKPFDPTARAGFADDMARFDSLMTTFTNAAGTVGEDDRVKAFEDLQTLSATGRTGGMGDERAKQFNAMVFDSDIGQRSRQLQQSYAATISANAPRGAAAVTQAAASYFNNLSGSDQNVLFRTNINATDRTGAKPYTDVQSFKDNLNAQASMTAYMVQSGVLGANGAIDQGAASAKAATDSKFAGALKLFQMKDNNAASWTQQVAKLFGAPDDKVNLSDAAKKSIGDVKVGSGVVGYREGSMASKTV